MPPPIPNVKDVSKTLRNIEKEAQSVHASGVEYDAILTQYTARISELEEILKKTEADRQDLKNKSGHRFEKEAAAIELKRVRDENKNLKAALGKVQTTPTGNLPNQLQENPEVFQQDVRRRFVEIRRGVKALIEKHFDLSKKPPAPAEGVNTDSKEEDGHLPANNALQWFDQWQWNTLHNVDRKNLVNCRIYQILHREFFSRPLFGFKESESAGGGSPKVKARKVEEPLRYYERLLLSKKVLPGKVADWVRMTIASAEEMGSYYSLASAQHPTRIANSIRDCFYPILKGASYEEQDQCVKRIGEICQQAVSLVLKLRKIKDRWVFVSWDDFSESLKDMPYTQELMLNRVGFQGEEVWKPGMTGTNVVLQVFGGLCYHKRREDYTFEEQGHVLARSRVILDLDEDWQEGNKDDEPEQDGPPRKKVKTVPESSN
ncbi:hypothetical protein V8F33_011087 [Rhypophila sp. PSN 637]